MKKSTKLTACVAINEKESMKQHGFRTMYETS